MCSKPSPTMHWRGKANPINAGRNNNRTHVFPFNYTIINLYVSSISIMSTSNIIINIL